MIVASLGWAQHFNDIPAGGAFLFRRDSEKHFAIKAVSASGSGAVVFGHPQFAGVPIFLDAHIFARLVFAMPELRFVPSPLQDDISMGQGFNYDSGKLYLFGHEQDFLAFKYQSVPGGHADDVLLNIRTGEVKDFRSFQDLPVVISRWAFVTTLWDKPKTLFTFPAGSPPLEF